MFELATQDEILWGMRQRREFIIRNNPYNKIISLVDDDEKKTLQTDKTIYMPQMRDTKTNPGSIQQGL